MFLTGNILITKYILKIKTVYCEKHSVRPNPGLHQTRDIDALLTKYPSLYSVYMTILRLLTTSKIKVSR